MSFLTVLFLIFMTLKLTDVIDWSWWLVSLPLWGIPVFFLFAAGMALSAAAGISAIQTSRRDPRTRRR